MKSDDKKGIAITYNLLNLPASVTKSGSNTITFTYDASGRKLKKQFGSNIRDYVDGIEYQNGVIDFVQTAEGRATPSGSAYNYEYMLKDHLGNTRALVKQDGSILDINDYYAFGLEMNPDMMEPSQKNEYKYNGKEWNTELSLNAYDYGARFYDPVIGRWTSVDPLTEEFDQVSPYKYAMNNPMLMIDPDGMAADSVKNGGMLKEVVVAATNFRWPTWTYYIPILGAAAESGNNLASGDYVASLANFGTSLAELAIAGTLSEFRLGTSTATQTVKSASRNTSNIARKIHLGKQV